MPAPNNPNLLKCQLPAVHQRVAAVLMPLILAPSRNITPPPKKTTPDTICEAILVGLLSPGVIIESMTNVAEPKVTSTFIFNTSLVLSHCLSIPILTARRKPTSNRITNVVQVMSY